MRGAIAAVAALLISGCASSKTTSHQPITLEFRLVAQSETVAKSTEGLTKVVLKTAGRDETVWLEPEVLLSNADVRSARAVKQQHGPEIELVFTQAGQSTFTAITEKHVKRRLAVAADGRVLTAPVIYERIIGDRAMISGGFTYEEAKRIAAGIVPR
jgi:preprotein translocase subunit SecD